MVTLIGFAQKRPLRRIFSRKGAKAQRKSSETRQRFASLRETFSRNNALFVQSYLDLKLAGVSSLYEG